MTPSEYGFSPDLASPSTPAAIKPPELLDAIFQSSSDGLFLIHETSRQIVHCNCRALELFDAKDREELLLQLNNHPQRKLLSDEELNALSLSRQQTSQPEIVTQGGWRVERKYTTLQEKSFWAILRAKIVLVHGKSLFLIQVTDISERKQLETLKEQFWQGIIHDQNQINGDVSGGGLHWGEALRVENAHLKRATRMKDEFLASISHELRTPLNAILGISEGILDSRETLTPNQRSLILAIETSGRHLLKLINDVLEIAKIESGTLNLELEPTSVAELCDFSLLCVRRAAQRKQLQILTEIPEDVGWILADNRRMRQILINLLNNAVKFTDQGSITLSVILNRQQQQLLFQIRDTGIGIAPDQLEHLFEAFVQVKSSLNRRQQGTGLGLALVKNILTLMGGAVSVESKLEHGSCFTVTLPWKPTNPLCDDTIPSILPLGLDQAPRSFGSVTPSIPSASEAAIGDGIANETDALTTSGGDVFAPTGARMSIFPQILLIEDDEINLKTFSNYFRQRGYRLLIAHNGREGVELAKLYEPQIILMDIQMPEMDGFTAIRLIREDRKLAQTPIIALTAMAMVEDRENCLAAGATEYCSKPVRLRELAEMIQVLLEPKSVDLEL